MNSRLPPRPAPRKRPLTERETQILQLLDMGLSAKQVGRTLDISPETVISCKKRIAEKFDLETTKLVVLLRQARQAGVMLSFIVALLIASSPSYKIRTPNAPTKGRERAVVIHRVKANQSILRIAA